MRRGEVNLTPQPQLRLRVKTFTSWFWEVSCWIPGLWRLTGFQPLTVTHKEDTCTSLVHGVKMQTCSCDCWCIMEWSAPNTIYTHSVTHFHTSHMLTFTQKHTQHIHTYTHTHTYTHIPWEHRRCRICRYSSDPQTFGSSSGTHPSATRPAGTETIQVTTTTGLEYCLSCCIEFLQDIVMVSCPLATKIHSKANAPFSLICYHKIFCYTLSDLCMYWKPIISAW